MMTTGLASLSQNEREKTEENKMGEKSLNSNILMTNLNMLCTK